MDLAVTHEHTGFHKPIVLADQRQKRRVRAGQPLVHGPYSYGKPTDRVQVTDQMVENVMAARKDAEHATPPAVRPQFFWMGYAALLVGALAFLHRFVNH